MGESPAVHKCDAIHEDENHQGWSKNYFFNHGWNNGKNSCNENRQAKIAHSVVPKTVGYNERYVNNSPQKAEKRAENKSQILPPKSSSAFLTESLNLEYQLFTENLLAFVSLLL